MRTLCDLSVVSASCRPRQQWRPSALFTGGAPGAWYDPSVFSSVWQDVAGTVPATIGQPVARLDDLSGHANHALQSLTAARPVLSVDAEGHRYLEFDGVDDILEAPAGPNHTQASLAIGYRTALAGENGGAAFGVGRFASGRFYLQTSYGSTRFIMQPQTGAALSGMGLGAEEKHIASARVGPGSDDFSMATNNTPGTWAGAGAQEMALTDECLHIGGRYHGSSHSATHFFGGIYIARALSDVEMEALVGFLAKKTGVLL